MKKFIKHIEHAIGDLTGKEKIAALLQFSQLLDLMHRKFPEKLIDQNLSLIESIKIEESSLLLRRKAVFCNNKGLYEKALMYTVRALRLAREIGSRKAEAEALIMYGYIEDAKGEYRKAAAWYSMALEKCTRFQRPRILLDIGNAYAKLREYERARVVTTDAENKSKLIINSKTVSLTEKVKQQKIWHAALHQLSDIHDYVGDYEKALIYLKRAQKIDLPFGFLKSPEDALMEVVQSFPLFSSTGKMAKSQTMSFELILHFFEMFLIKEKSFDSRIKLLLYCEWGRLQRNSSKYLEAMKFYALAFESMDNSKKVKNIKDCNYFYADILSNMLLGVHECLVGMNKLRIAEALLEKMLAYETIRKGIGITNEMGKNMNLEFAYKNLGNFLAGIFEKNQLVIRYRNIVAQYDPETGRALVEIGCREKFELQKRAFFLFKYFVDHAGEYVTCTDIEKYWEENNEHTSKNPSESVVREYVRRYMKKNLGLAQFLERYPGKKAMWRLKA